MDERTASNMVENFKEKLQTKEGQDWLKKFSEEIEEQERQKRELVENTDYIKWLENFTKKYPDFSDYTWLYRQDEIDKEDYEKVCKLSTFFSVIDDFAENNYIPAYVCGAGSGICYFIKYNERIYDIGTIVGQGAVSYCNATNYCSKTTAVGNSTVINFDEIANPSESTRIRTALVENQLERIDYLLNDLVNNKKLNIPIEAIISRTDKVLKELKEKAK